MSELREAIARAMQESKAWPVVFESGSAYVLADAALAAIEASGYKVEEHWEHAIKRLNIPMLPSLRTRQY
jgi:hypothetical protein